MSTVSPGQPSLLRELSANHIRLTAQRRALLEIIQGTKGHLDAGMLLKLARKRNAKIDRATVYRTLEVLKRLHLVNELDLMHLTGEGHFYEARGAVEHVHLACIGCGRIEEFVSPLFNKLKGEIARHKGFEITDARLEVGGYCDECRNSKGSKNDPGSH